MSLPGRHHLHLVGLFLFLCACGDSGDPPNNSLRDAPVTSQPDAASTAHPDGPLADAGPIAGDVFLDPAGDDTHAGTEGAPYQTFAKAAATVGASHTIWLAGGDYNQTNQKAAVLTVPDGVTVSSLPSTAPTLTGLTVNLGGASGGMSGLTLDSDAGLVVNRATPGTLTLDHITFLNPTAHQTRLEVRGMAKVNLVEPSVSGVLRSGRVSLFENAEVVVTGGTFDGGMLAGGAGFGSSVFVMNGSSKLTLDGTTVKDVNFTGIGVNGSGAASVTLKGGTVFDTVGAAGNCASSAAIVLAAHVTLDATDSTIRNSPSSGICVRNGGAGIAIALHGGVLLENDGAALSAEPGSVSSATLTIEDATFRGNSIAGLNWAGGGTFDIHGATFADNGIGMQLQASALAVTLRDTSITGSGTFGIQLFHSGGAATIDLGTSADAGGNTFTGSATTNFRVSILGADVVNAVGNTWNPSVQGADGSGHFPAGKQATMTMATDTGTNYQLTAATTVNL